MVVVDLIAKTTIIKISTTTAAAAKTTIKSTGMTVDITIIMKCA